MNETKKYWFTSSSGIIEFQMTGEQAQSVSHQGSCDKDCEVLKNELKLELDKINPDDIKKELDELGAWNDEELSDHEQNLIRLVWIAGCDIAESNIIS